MVDYSCLADGTPVEYLDWRNHRQTGKRYNRDLFSHHQVAGFIPADESIDKQAGDPDRQTRELIPIDAGAKDWIIA